jgi:outer membrane protein W
MTRKLAGGLLALLLTATASPLFANDMSGYGAIGIRGGTLFFTQDEDLKEQAQPRLSGDLVLSYGMTDRITADVTIGWGWNRLDTGTDSFYVANIVPLFPIGARYMIREGTMRPFVGAGGGLYNWSILSEDLGAAKDPVTFERLRRVDFGLYGVAGVERQMSKHITMTLDGSYTRIFAADELNFPSGYNGDKAYFSVRLGASFWFSLSERIDTGLPD